MDRNAQNGESEIPGKGAGADLDPGLYLLSVPIGNAADITLRAIDVLTRADLVACEDTRSLRRLVSIHGLRLRQRPLSYHDSSPPGALLRIKNALVSGKAVAYAPEAGTALVSDPGYRLVQAAIEEGRTVYPVPGASAPLAALLASGMPSDRFLCAGFLPARSAARLKSLEELAVVPATLVVFEAPHRLAACLKDLALALGDRPAAVAREMTKRFEEVRRGNLSELAEQAAAEKPRGEHTIVIAPPGKGAAQTRETAEYCARPDESVSAAARRIARETGLPRRDVYRQLLERRKDEGG